MRILLILGTTFLFIASCTTEPGYPSAEEAETAVIAKEQEALDMWSAGNPGGFTVNMADEVTYTDDIGAHSMISGLEHVQEYLSSLEGMISPHDYEMLDPKVRIFGNTAILTFWYQGSVDDQSGPPWKVTSVYNFTQGEWEMVHAHWSLVEVQSENPAE